MTTSIVAIDYSLVKVLAPKKYDGCYICKVYYGEGGTCMPHTKGGKFIVDVPNVKIVKLKRVSESSYFCYIKLPSKLIPGMLCLEDHVIDLCKLKSREWFSNKLKHSTIDESFQSCVAIHKDFGNILKVRIENPQNDLVSSIEEFSICNVELRLHSIKFVKHSFYLLWDISQSFGHPTGCMFSNEVDSEVDSEVDGDDEFGPTRDEIEQIKVDMVQQIDTRINRIQEQIHALSLSADNLKGCLPALLEGRVTLKDLDLASAAIRDCDD
jgi:hypothetical protein